MTDSYSVSIYLCWATLAILSILVWENGRIPKEKKKDFYLAYIVLAAAALAEWAGIRLSGAPGMPLWIMHVIKCADYILTPLVGWAMLRHTNPSGVLYKLLIYILVANTVFQIISSFFGWTAEIDERGYHEGPLFGVYMGICAVVVILVLIEFVRYGRAFRKQNLWSLYAVLILVVAGFVIQEFVPGNFRTAYLALTFSQVLLFIHYLEFSQMRSDEKLARQQADILLLQMRPHFIYNTLNSIYYLCAQDSSRAQEVIMAFTEYLQMNFTAIAKVDMIPFTDELHHARAYLWVEMARYEDKLSVDYDTPVEDFKLPPLTLQPIVENAVKHGLSPELPPLSIKVKTKKTKAGIEVIVEDNGPGYQPVSDDKPHIALENIKQRMELMCKGSLDIESGENGGTVVKLMIPQ